VSKGTSDLFTVSRFAELAGVTVRALHHYDRLGLLKPSGRTGAGYRLYTSRDLARLQQIVTLKFIGFSLEQIGEILDRKPFDLKSALHTQRQIIADKRRHLAVVMRAIEGAERALARSRECDWEKFRKIIEVIEMQNNTDWMKQYYGDKTWKKIQERRPQWSPELQEQATKDWTQLFRDVEAALGEDPSSPKAQELAARWRKLIESFTGEDGEISAGLGKLYADRANWPAGFQQQMAPFSNPKVMEFIHKAIAAAKK
jgi:DNA-binding transcriptional MerR regulator